MSQPLSWDKAAAAVGMAGDGRGRRLKRMVFARERHTGKRIATRLGTTRNPKYRVSLSSLRKHLPELFKSKVDELSDNLKAYLRSIDERIAAGVAAHVEEYVEPKFEELWKRDEQIAEQVSQLALRVVGLAEVRSNRP